VVAPRLDGTTASPPGGGHWPFLDLLRFGAALLVLFGHVRGLLFVSIQDVPGPGLGTKAFYFLTGIHREGVAIFFAVSGFLVGGAVWRSIRDRRFDARSYLTSRFVRIYLVFLPAIALTLLLDWAGRHFFLDTRFYGVRPLMPVGVTSGWSWSQMGCHLAGFQGIFCMPLGANIPLWSLGFEWVFYLMAPPIFWLCLAKYPTLKYPRLEYSRLLRAGGGAVLFLSLAYFAGGFESWIPWLAIWIAGAMAAQVVRRRERPVVEGLAGIALIAAGFVIARLQVVPPVATDVLVGFGTAVAIANGRLLAWCPVERLVRAGADCSYSLYLVHLPVVVFLGALLERFGWPAVLVQPGPFAYLAFAGLVAAVLGAAFLFAQATERHTNAVRGLLLARPRQAAPATLP
jgi:peptidoglycan/LPS O-acetylase OafA/YrhL